MIEFLFQNVVGISLSTSVIILTLFLLLPLLRKQYPAKWRVWAWLVVSIRLLVPFHLTLPQTSLPPPSLAGRAGIPSILQKASDLLPLNTTVIPQAEINAGTQSLTVNEILSLVWLFGAVSFIIYHMAGYFLFKKSVLRFSTAVSDPYMKDQLCEIKEQLKIKKDIRILSCKTVQSPMMTGFLKPILILPSSELCRLDLGVVIKHELIHYKRKDIWVKLLLICANAVHWFNPLVYWMVAASNRDMELACDSETIKNADIPFREQYGKAILSAVYETNHRGTAFSTYFCGGKRSMKERLRNILDTGKKHKGIVALCLLIVAVCITGGLLAVNYTNAHSSDTTQKVITIQQAIGLNLDSIDCIDARNGDIPQRKITNQSDIQALLEPFLSSQIKQVSSQKAAELNEYFHSRLGGVGFNYAIYKKGKPYIDFYIQEDMNLILFCKYNTFFGDYGDSVYYDFVTPIDTDAINRLTAKYRLDTY